MKHAECKYYPSIVHDMCNTNCTFDPDNDISGNKAKTCKAYCAYNNKLYNDLCSTTHPILNYHNKTITSKDCADSIIKKCAESIATNLSNDKYKNAGVDIDKLKFKDFHNCLKENKLTDC